MMSDPILSRIVPVLAGVPGIAAVALGGSRARGTATETSDYDIGLYFSAAQPIDTGSAVGKCFLGMLGVFADEMGGSRPHIPGRRCRMVGRRRQPWTKNGYGRSAGISEYLRWLMTCRNAQVVRVGPGADYSGLQRIPVTLKRLSPLSPAGSSLQLRLLFGMSRPPGI